MPSGTRTIGEFCWINVLTPRPDEARDFFSSLFNWSYVPMPSMGHRIQVNGQDFGGIFDINSVGNAGVAHAGIGVMVKVESADETAARVQALGGKAKPAFDIADRGRMAECFDPTGAQFDVWQPMKSTGMEIDARIHGAPTWFECTTRDVERAKPFYTELFGWRAQSIPMGDFEYTEFHLGSNAVGAMMPVLPHMGNMPSFWAVYFAVDNADDTVKRAMELNGVICVEPQDIPNVGRFAGITSPQGVMFYVMQYA